MTNYLNKGLPDPDDPVVPREPIDRVARRVTGKGEHFGGFSTPNEFELCSPNPIPLRMLSDRPDSLPKYEGIRSGNLTVIGLATIEHNSAYLNRDKQAISRTNYKRSKKAYQGTHFEKIATRKSGGARWVCRCSCGNYTLRSSKGIRKNIARCNDGGWADACLQCRELDKERRGVRGTAPENRKLRKLGVDKA